MRRHLIPLAAVLIFAAMIVAISVNYHNQQGRPHEVLVTGDGPMVLRSSDGQVMVVPRPHNVEVRREPSVNECPSGVSTSAPSPDGRYNYTVCAP